MRLAAPNEECCAVPKMYQTSAFTIVSPRDSLFCLKALTTRRLAKTLAAPLAAKNLEARIDRMA